MGLNLYPRARARHDFKSNRYLLTGIENCYPYPQTHYEKCTLLKTRASGQPGLLSPHRAIDPSLPIRNHDSLRHPRPPLIPSQARSEIQAPPQLPPSPDPNSREARSRHPRLSDDFESSTLRPPPRVLHSLPPSGLGPLPSVEVSDFALRRLQPPHPLPPPPSTLCGLLNRSIAICSFSRSVGSCVLYLFRVYG